MTSNEAEPVVIADEGVQQIPAVIQVTQPAATVSARDSLLEAIGREAQLVAEKFPGQASTALEQLARAFALVASATPAVADVTKGARSLALTNEVPIDGPATLQMKYL
ncbi:hypothetical protein [Streptomyces sp. NPDC020667]|uniref:hypothetical protein n=1 Tax=Streptomyces sp. NPDC020667 TaxID=3154895 RepID=UPI0033D97634